MLDIDQYSLATVPIEQFFNDTSLGNATGFVWKTQDAHFLITNWHVVTCRYFPKGRNLRDDAGRPNKLRLLFNLSTLTFGKQQHDIAIRDVDDRPLWLAHPARNVDVVAMPLHIQGTAPIMNPYPINTLSNTALRIRVGMDVYILGYPFGAEPPGFPVWKRGSIASEPDLAPMTNDYFLVDSASRPGMSGAPVIRRSWGTHLLDNGGIIQDNTGTTKFIGIYSGRLYTAEAEAQIGMVWPTRIIEEIIAGGKRDED
jgi:hypothetical protein